MISLWCWWRLAAHLLFQIFKPKQAVQGGTDLSELDELDFDDGDDEYLSAEANEQEDEGE